MNSKQFSEAMGEIDDWYIEKAVSYQAKNAFVPHTKRRVFFPLVAALIAVVFIGSAVAAAFLYGDLWLQKPDSDPVKSVRTALENQAGKNYTIKIEIKSVEIDKEETERVVERFIEGVIADRRGWSSEYLAEHFLVVKAVYYAEYDHAQTTRSDGEVTMYFYLTQDVDSGKWTIVDNSGNVNWSENDPTDERKDPTVKRSTREQLFAYLSELFNKAYSIYYDGLHYEINDYEEVTDGRTVTATFRWTMYHIGKGWDVGTDEGVEQEANWSLQAVVAKDENGAFDWETIVVFYDDSAKGDTNYSVPIEKCFPTQLGDQSDPR